MEKTAQFPTCYKHKHNMFMGISLLELKFSKFIVSIWGIHFNVPFVNHKHTDNTLLQMFSICSNLRHRRLFILLKVPRLEACSLFCQKKKKKNWNSSIFKPSCHIDLSGGCSKPSLLCYSLPRSSTSGVNQSQNRTVGGSLSSNGWKFTFSWAV